MNGVRTIKRDEWLAEGNKLFGEDMRHWKFVCPNCKGIQTVNDFLDLLDYQVDVNRDQAYSSCIGRYDPRIKPADIGTIGDGKSPCNYTNGGLFGLYKLVVIMDGKETPCFEFAT